MKKCKAFFDIEKEENWLNEQLQKGYRCTNISALGIYTFKKTDKHYVMRLDYQNSLAKDKFKEYKEMYEDFGWHYVKGFGRSGIQYWQKEDDNQNEIYSDRQSKCNYYKRLMNYTSSLMILSLILSFALYKDSGLYLTEGLWHMEGSLFLKAFLFETPFVLLRLLPALMVVLFGLSFYKFYRKRALLIEK